MFRMIGRTERSVYTMNKMKRITYPASYKNLCIGIGGCSYYGVNEAEEKFLCGVTAFKNLKDYRMKPSNWHFMRVR